MLLFPKRALLYLLLLAILASPGGSNNANVALDDASEEDDDRYDDVATFDATKNDNKVIRKATTASSGARVHKPAAFLRRNNSKAGQTEGKSREIFQKAFHKAIGGGVPGAIAGVVQVLSLMWLRTVINYQYRYGSSFIQAITTLYGMGGIPRLYAGLPFALIQAPLSRFVSTAANDGVAVLLQDLHWGPGREVIVAAIVVGLFRIMLMPIDTCKTVLQIENGKGLALLMAKVKKGHVNLLYSGAFANAMASFIGHYPWFYTYNLLSRNEALTNLIQWTTGRNALIGFMSSIISDTVANFMRVIKTTKQALGSTRSGTTYGETISVILAKDGWRGLFGRGLKTRIMGNALQSILFTVIWRSLSERWQEEKSDANVMKTNENDAENAKYEKGAR
mmetsp:Transcript_6996/g.17345  ORF Transcript_6996/g.17345 Transcript_6996/m.17345 type:complete len:393 (-) Transcript_6996:122-1300(-)|eukprot:CAMPEP_0181137302 /NCGR_PEP_ID=MMETSP1071-20121207/33637_1 /TAXON_ID=35127 /ORGANISM="Thalassiosira sp., Strain NH16" /LENGTH=392 /DNA_ID=CAMNT_0023224055 /DNA_START=92 /DNA_END=1270 /DNA_ORIENTATION=+